MKPIPPIRTTTLEDVLFFIVSLFCVGVVLAPLVSLVPFTNEYVVFAPVAVVLWLVLCHYHDELNKYKQN